MEHHCISAKDWWDMLSLSRSLSFSCVCVCVCACARVGVRGGVCVCVCVLVSAQCSGMWAFVHELVKLSAIHRLAALPEPFIYTRFFLSLFLPPPLSTTSPPFLFLRWSYREHC